MTFKRVMLNKVINPISNSITKGKEVFRSILLRFVFDNKSNGSNRVSYVTLFRKLIDVFHLYQTYSLHKSTLNFR